MAPDDAPAPPKADSEAQKEANHWVDRSATELFHLLTKLSRFLNTRIPNRDKIWRLSALTLGTVCGRFIGRAEHWGGPDFAALLSGDITRAMATSAADERSRLVAEEERRKSSSSSDDEDEDEEGSGKRAVRDPDLV